MDRAPSQSLPTARRATAAFWALAALAAIVLAVTFAWRGPAYGLSVAAGSAAVGLCGQIYDFLCRRALERDLAGAVHVIGRLSMEMPDELRYLADFPNRLTLGAIWWANGQLLVRSFSVGNREFLRFPVESITSISYASRSAFLWSERVIVIRTTDTEISIAPRRSGFLGLPLPDERFLAALTDLRYRLSR